MKAVFVVDTLGAGGAERSLQELLPPFRAAGVQPIVVCFHHRQQGVEDLVLRDYDVRILHGRHRLEQMRELRRIVQAERADIAHTTLFEADVFGRTALARTVPIVTSLVNMPYEAARLARDPNVTRLKLGVARGLEVATGRLFATHFHAITQAVKESAIQRLHIPEQRITVVYRGRSAARLGKRSAARRASVRQALGVNEGQFVFLNAARQEFQKGQVHLIEAFKQLRPRLPNAELWIAGRNGNATTQLQQAAGDAAGVRFLGHRDDLPELLAAADAFVLPSLWEGLGGVLIEAMALMLPIISSDLPPTREVLANGERGLLVPPGAAAELSDAMLKLATKPDLAVGLGNAGYRAFEEHFTIEASANQLLALFERVLSRA